MLNTGMFLRRLGGDEAGDVCTIWWHYTGSSPDPYSFWACQPLETIFIEGVTCNQSTEPIFMENVTCTLQRISM